MICDGSEFWQAPVWSRVVTALSAVILLVPLHLQGIVVDELIVSLYAGFAVVFKADIALSSSFVGNVFFNNVLMMLFLLLVISVPALCSGQRCAKPNDDENHDVDDHPRRHIEFKHWYNHAEAQSARSLSIIDQVEEEQRPCADRVVILPLLQDLVNLTAPRSCARSRVYEVTPTTPTTPARTVNDSATLSVGDSNVDHV